LTTGLSAKENRRKGTKAKKKMNEKIFEKHGAKRRRSIVAATIPLPRNP